MGGKKGTILNNFHLALESHLSRLIYTLTLGSQLRQRARASLQPRPKTHHHVYCTYAATSSKSYDNNQSDRQHTANTGGNTALNINTHTISSKHRQTSHKQHNSRAHSPLRKKRQQSVSLLLGTHPYCPPLWGLSNIASITGG